MENGVTQIIINAPIHSRSFYGMKSRELIKAILVLRPEWNIRIFNYDENNVRNDFIDNDIDFLIQSYDESTPDIWIQIGNPLEYIRKGIKNIGITYSYDFNPIDKFILGCDNMDLIVTYSKYSADMMQSFERKIDANNSIKITTPIIILPEYSSIACNKALMDNKNNSTLLNDIDTPWNFIVDGYWETTDPIDFGGRNKDNIGFIITNFLSTFSNTDINIGLILKVHGNIPSNIDRINLEKKIAGYYNGVKGSNAKIYLINGDLNEEDTWKLYSDSKIKAMISIPQRSDTVHNEIEFAFSTGKPIIYSNYAAQKEYLSYKGNIEINGDIKQINGGGPMIVDSYSVELKLSMYEMYHHYNDLMIDSYDNSRAVSNALNKDNYIFAVNNLLNEIIQIPTQQDD